MKIPEIRSEVARYQFGILGKKIHAYSFMYFAFIFSEHITINSSKETLKLFEHSLFQEV